MALSTVIGLQPVGATMIGHFSESCVGMSRRWEREIAPSWGRCGALVHHVASFESGVRVDCDLLLMTVACSCPKAMGEWHQGDAVTRHDDTQAIPYEEAVFVYH